MIKKIIYKIIGFSLLILFGLDSTTFLEGLDENQETENNSIQKQSWWDWLKKNKFNIGIVSLILSTTLLLYYYKNNTFSFFEIYVPSIDLIINELENIVTPELYDSIIKILVLIKSNPDNLDAGIALLQNILNSIDNQYIKEQILVPEEFTKLILLLIKELKKN